MPFKLSSFIREIGFDLDGVWGGLTKRTRNILKDRDARLVVWKNYYGQDGKWTDAEGTLAEGTIESLRKALNITKVG